MAIRKAAPKGIDEYIAAAPSKARPILEKIRRIVRVRQSSARAAAKRRKQ